MNLLLLLAIAAVLLVVAKYLWEQSDFGKAGKVLRIYENCVGQKY